MKPIGSIEPIKKPATAEKESAQKVLDEVNKKLNGKVVTVIRKEKNYCKAEDYHQKYIQKKN